MKIYTRTGDDGFTHRANGHRVRKSDALMEAIGAVDELHAHIGLCEQAASGTAIGEAMSAVQEDLFTVGAMLAWASGGEEPKVTLGPSAVEQMEAAIDDIWAELGELKHFILPGGCELACRLHVARTVCRRAERAVVAAVERETRIPKIVFAYLNRLGDLLFALARKANRDGGIEDRTWGG